MAPRVPAYQDPRPAPATTSDAYGRAADDAIAQNKGGNSVQSGQAGWNSDTRPVVIGIIPSPMTELTKSQVPQGGWNGGTTNVLSVYEARQYLSDWRAARATGDQSYDHVVALLRKTGFLGEKANSFSSIETAWADALSDGASLYASNPSRSADVFDYLNGLVASGQTVDDDDGGGGGAYTGPTSQINLTDPGSAQQLVDQALMQHLGRKANDKETKAFLNALNKRQMNNPTVNSPNGPHGRIVSGGFNPQTFADNWAASREGAAEFTTATTFLDTFMKSLGNPNEVL